MSRSSSDDSRVKVSPSEDNEKQGRKPSPDSSEEIRISHEDKIRSSTDDKNKSSKQRIRTSSEASSSKPTSEGSSRYTSETSSPLHSGEVSSKSSPAKLPPARRSPSIDRNEGSPSHHLRNVEADLNGRSHVRNSLQNVRSSRDIEDESSAMQVKERDNQLRKKDSDSSVDSNCNKRSLVSVEDDLTLVLRGVDDTIAQMMTKLNDSDNHSSQSSDSGRFH